MLEWLLQIQGEEASKKAASVGRVYFNILRLECGESKYPSVCIQSHPKEDNLAEVVDEDIIQGAKSLSQIQTYPCVMFWLWKSIVSSLEMSAEIYARIQVSLKFNSLITWGAAAKLAGDQLFKYIHWQNINN